MASSVVEIFTHFQAAVKQLPFATESVKQTLTSATVQARLYAGLPLIGNVSELLHRFNALYTSVQDNVKDLYHVCFFTCVWPFRNLIVCSQS